MKINLYFSCFQNILLKISLFSQIRMYLLPLIANFRLVFQGSDISFTGYFIYRNITKNLTEPLNIKNSQPVYFNRERGNFVNLAQNFCTYERSYRPETK